MIGKLKSQRNEGTRRYAVAAVVGAVFLCAAFGIYMIVSDTSAPKKRVVETIALKLVPPPPPPPPKVEPPPEPPKLVEEQKIEPPVDKPDDRPKDEAPPPGPLALDAQGGPGGDAFGLGGKPGGSDFLLGNGTGGNGGGNRFGRYAVLMQGAIDRRLHQDDKLDIGKFRTTIRIWLTDAGKVQKVELVRTTGDGDLDQRIESAIGSMPTLSEPPPKEMPQPVIVRIGATPGFG